MELGARLKQARLEAGLSQRQLCGDVITRNMLSQIENGTARPSMDTLRYLAARLEKSVSFFLEEDVIRSPNQELMALARQAWESGEYGKTAEILKEYRGPDDVFDREKTLLENLTVLALAEMSVQEGRYVHGAQLLEEMKISPYCAEEMERKKLLLLAKVAPRRRREICAALPDLDEELLLRARDALDRGLWDRASALLDAAENQDNSEWNFLRGEVYLARQQYAPAAGCYHKAEQAYPDKTASRLERCYREMKDFKQAYFYACKQR